MGTFLLIFVGVVIVGAVSGATGNVLGITNGGVGEPGRAIGWLAGGCLLVVLILGFGVQEHYINGVALRELLIQLLS
jgi:hypothetical protein